MTDFARENAKLIMLFALIVTVIGLSHLNVNTLAKLKSALTGPRAPTNFMRRS